LTAARQRSIALFGFVADFTALHASMLGPDFAADVTPEVRALAEQQKVAVG
jgi:hypothetical protein